MEKLKSYVVECRDDELEDNDGISYSNYEDAMTEIKAHQRAKDCKLCVLWEFNVIFEDDGSIHDDESEEAKFTYFTIK